MTNNTWNFPTWQCMDWGTYDRPGGAGGVRGAHGMVWAIGPELGSLQPFTNTITGVFSIFLRSGWSDVSHTLTQNITSIGGRSGASWGLLIKLIPDVGGSRLFIGGYDVTSALARHQVELGDEDGVNWIQADKWYQVAFSMSATDFSYCVNGSTTPKVNVVSAVDGTLNLSAGSDRWWWHAGRAANSSYRTVQDSEQILIEDGWPTCAFGTAAFDTNYIDLTSSVVRGRIFDADGNFKNPGEDGSLWFGDTYAANTPDFFFLDGSPRRDNGTYNASVPQVWAAASGGGAGSRTAPGGLRKQYENIYPDSWHLYQSLAEAEASAHPWVDGDTIYTPATGGVYVYMSALAVDGYSGLIHKYPFGRSGGEPSVITVRGSEAANSNPDSWGAYSMINTGTNGVDYVNDTNGGLSRMRNLTNSGSVIAYGNYQITANDSQTFRIIDACEVDALSLSDGTLYHELLAWIDASNYHRIRVYPFGTPTPGPYYYSADPAAKITTYTSSTPRRIWIYIKGGMQAVWFDDAGGPASGAGQTPVTVSGSTVPLSRTDCGQTGASPFTVKMGTDVFGSMTLT